MQKPAHKERAQPFDWQKIYNYPNLKQVYLGQHGVFERLEGKDKERFIKDLSEDVAENGSWEKAEEDAKEFFKTKGFYYDENGNTVYLTEQAGSKPIQKKETLEEMLIQQGADLKGVDIDRLEDFISYKNPEPIKRYKLKLTEGAFAGKSAYRCPEDDRALYVWVAGEGTEHLHLACESGHATTFDKAIDLRKIGKDKVTTKWAKKAYAGWLAEAKEEGFDTVADYYNSDKNLTSEYTKLGVGLEKIFNPDASKKEPPLISDPQRKSYDPKFEEAEAERMKEEVKKEREFEDAEADWVEVQYEDPSAIYGSYPEGASPEEEEFSDLLGEAILTGVITDPESIKSKWWASFYHNYPRNTDSTTGKLQELIKEHENKQKPKGKPASEALFTLYPEEHYFGTEVTVVTEKGNVDYTGKILRLLNGGTLAEVRPSGDEFKGSSFRVPIEQVYVNKVVETKESSKTEPEQKPSPKIAISKTDSHSVYLVGDIKDRSFVALANIIVTEDGRILELPGMDYMKGRDYPSENFNFTTVKEYLEDLKAKKEEVKRKQQEEKEAYERKEAEIKERLSKPPSGYFIHKQDENGDPNLEPVTGKVYPFEHQGIDLFAFKDTKGWNTRTSWNVSERHTGLFVSGGRTKVEAIQKAKEYIDKKGAGEVKRQIKVALGKMGKQ